MQAANLFERMVKSLTKALGRTDAGTVFSSSAGPKGRNAAQRALLAVIISLDAWAGPLKVHQQLYLLGFSHDNTLPDDHTHAVCGNMQSQPPLLLCK